MKLITPLRTLAAALLFGALLTFFAGVGAFAQDYGKIVETLGGAAGGAAAGAPEAPPADTPPADTPPADTPPVVADGADDGPDFAAYGEVAETFSEQSALEMTQQQVGVFRQKARRVFGAASSYFSEFERTLDAASPTGEAVYFAGVFMFTLFILSIGRAGLMLYVMYVALPVMRRVQKPHPDGIVEKLPVLAVRVLLSFGGMAVVLAIAAAIGAGFYQEHEATLKTVIAIVSALAISQMVDVLWRMVVSPFLPEYRIPAIDDRSAVRLYSWLAAGAFFGVSSTIFAAWLRDLGAAEETVALTYIGVTFVSVMTVIGMVRSCGAAISAAILGGQKRSEASWIAALASFLWRPAIIIYMVGAWLEMSYRLIMGLPLGVPLLAGAFMVLLAALVVYAVTVYIIAQLFRRARAIRAANAAANTADAAEDIADPDKRAIRDALEEVGDGGDGGDEEGGAGPVAMSAPPPPLRRGMRTFEDLAHRVASLFALGAGAYALIRVWAGSDAFAEGGAFDVVQDLIDVAFIGYVTFHTARIWMDQKIEEEGGDQIGSSEPGDEGGAAAAASRLATILPLFRSFVLLIIAVTSIFLVLLELGVNVAPLFAGAGVVGLAIGFGAQTLVRDILSGVFFLSDDAFRKGEYIDVGEVKGTVEKISLRSFQLRHHLGALNTIPFGEIKHLTNYSRDWVMMKLPLRLTYDTDVDKVRKLIKKLGVALLDHPTEGHKFVQPLKSQGVYMMEDSAMIIRVKFMTRPGDQWTTRKLVYQEIRALFEKEGIKFAHKEVTVRIPDLDEGKRGGPLSPDEQKAIGAAARRAVEEGDVLEGAGAIADAR